MKILEFNHKYYLVDTGKRLHTISLKILRYLYGSEDDLEGEIVDIKAEIALKKTQIAALQTMKYFDRQISDLKFSLGERKKDLVFNEKALSCLKENSGAEAAKLLKKHSKIHIETLYDPLKDK